METIPTKVTKVCVFGAGQFGFALAKLLGDKWPSLPVVLFDTNKVRNRRDTNGTAASDRHLGPLCVNLVFLHIYRNTSITLMQSMSIPCSTREPQSLPM